MYRSAGPNVCRSHYRHTCIHVQLLWVRIRTHDAKLNRKEERKGKNKYLD